MKAFAAERNKNAAGMFRRLSLADFRDVGHATLCVFRAKRALRNDSLIEVLETLHLRSTHPTADSSEAHRAQQVVRWTHSFLPIAPNCLLDSLAAALWLKGRGLSLPLVIGVRKNGGGMEAHAWLEGSGEAPDDYRVLWRSSGVTP